MTGARAVSGWVVVLGSALIGACGNSGDHSAAVGGGGNGGNSGNGVAGSSGSGGTVMSGGGLGGGGGNGGSGGMPHVPVKLGVSAPVTGSFTDERDQNKYGWVELNGAKWMSENLRFVPPRQDLWTCYFDLKKSAQDCEAAGYFYGWSAAMGLPRIADLMKLGVGGGSYQGICPTGWHVPTHDEWAALFDYVNQLANGKPPDSFFGTVYEDISDPLLSATGWPPGYGTNELGFDAKPYDESDIGFETSFWASDEVGTQSAGVLKLTQDRAELDQDFKVFRHALRCVEGAASKPAPVVMGPPLTNTTGTFKDTRDEQSYATVTIGTQQWLAQNLAFVPAAGDSVCYAEEAELCRILGRMYGYDTAQSVCPTGWHIPTVAEWHALAQYVDDHSNKGGAMQDQNTFNWKIGDQLVAPWEVWQGAPKDPPMFGFNALPGGFGDHGAQSGSLEDEVLLWSAKDPAVADEIAVTINPGYLSTAPVRDGLEAYVRCLHD